MSVDLRRPAGRALPKKTGPKIAGSVQKELALLHRISESISSHLELSSVLREIVQMVLDVTRADACLIYLLDDARKELVLRASGPPHPKLIGRIHLEIGEGITGWVAKERHTVAISKNAEIDPRFTPFRSLPEDRFQAFLSTPVISRGEVIGVINVQHRKAHRHSQSEITLLTVIGHQVGSAIENARVHQEAQRKAMQIDTLARVSQTIASGQYLEEILHLIVAMTAGMMGSKICSIMLLDDTGTELQVVATQSLSDEYRRKAVKVEGSFSGQALKERRPITVADVTRDPNYGRPEMAKREGLCSLLSVPMVVSGRAIGVINLYTGSPHRFTQEESNLLRTVADQAAISIENTRLLGRASS